jgi:penicillin-binding protein 1C
VRVAAQLARGKGLYALLTQAGVVNLASEAHYGLALALGGGEVSAAELASLYASLSNGGRVRPLRYLTRTPLSPGVAVMSPEAAFITQRMLLQNPRPRAANRAKNVQVAWKTGTSWGFRDAWSVGTLALPDAGQARQPFVLAVWVGNFDGQGNPALTGLNAAAPLFFALVDDLAQFTRGARTRPINLPGQNVELKPLNVIQLDVCAASGDLPNADCPVVRKTDFIPGVTPIRVSTVHRRVYVDAKTGVPSCFEGAPPATVRQVVREFWPSEIAQSFAAAGLQLKTAPSCARVSSAAPSITAPLSGVSYELTPAELARPSLTLRASAAGGVRQLFWFVNASFVGTSAPGVGLALAPKAAGELRISVTDDAGGHAERTVRVRVR